MKEIDTLRRKESTGGCRIISFSEYFCNAKLISGKLVNSKNMKSVVFIFMLFFSLLSISASAQEKQVVVPYTLADRDRAIQIEAKLNALDAKFESIDKQFINQQRQIDDIKTLFYWGFGILISLFIFMLGYMIWDRRTAMQPALLQASKAEENSRNLNFMVSGTIYFLVSFALRYYD